MIFQDAIIREMRRVHDGPASSANANIIFTPRNHRHGRRGIAKTHVILGGTGASHRKEYPGISLRKGKMLRRKSVNSTVYALNTKKQGETSEGRYTGPYS